MACTAVIISGETGIVRLKFMTLPADEAGTELDIQLCDENFIPSQRINLSIDPRTEEAYHRALRIEAKSRQQFVQVESTDPQWSPDYVEEVEDAEHGDNCTL